MEPYVARRIPVDEFERATGCVASAERKAAKLLADARQEADACRAARQAEEDALRDLQQKAKDAAYLEAVGRETLNQQAKVAVDVLDEAARIRSEFRRLTPWLTDLVTQSLRKIIGQMDNADLVAATVAAAVAERASNEKLVIRVAAADHVMLKELINTNPARFEAVSEIVPDASLEQGALFLEGKGGLVSIGIDAQLTALKEHIVAHLSDGGIEE
ncbi:FliH/SctL family protein [Yoonia sp. 2307UL14-13]|uniref:FliH/SctL family protein n=1 Tax=Yoonia sp. 2307UL14-13 TaxID=3126506 RepID=UPI0030AED173